MSIRIRLVFEDTTATSWTPEWVPEYALSIPSSRTPDTSLQNLSIPGIAAKSHLWALALKHKP